MLSVVGFEPAAGARPSGVGLIADGWQVYGSPGSLYVAQDSRWWCWRSESERRAETHVHQFDLNAGSPTYAASGAVPGLGSVRALGLLSGCRGACSGVAGTGSIRCLLAVLQ